MTAVDDERDVPPPLREHGGLVSLILVCCGVAVCSLAVIYWPRWGLLSFSALTAIGGVARWVGLRRSGGEKPLALVVRRPAVDIVALFALCAASVVLVLCTPNL